MSKPGIRIGSVKRWIIGASVAVLAGAGAVALTGTANADQTCPASGWICLYGDNDFNRNLSVSRSQKSYHTVNNLTPEINGKLSSIRNRTNCTVRLYDGYFYSGNSIDIAPNSEVARIGYTFGSGWDNAAKSHKFLTPSGDC